MAGIYIHIPFCKQACNYCNFHFTTSLRGKNELVAALLSELSLRTGYLQNESIETIYFGGGTPSLLDYQELKLMVEKIFSIHNVIASAEITIEVNPDDVTAQKLKEWKEIGINRLSLGIQSFFEEDLKWMNRAHTGRQAIDSLELAITYFKNINIDLIYGLPSLADERWKHNVDKAVSLGIPHLSCYALTVEPKTRLHKMIKEGRVSDINSDKQSEQFLLLMQWMESAGYEHYEISNFAKPGLRSRHNSSYWSGKKYLGIGPSAHSFDGISRQWNVSSNHIYADSINKQVVPCQKEVLTFTQQLNEYIMTSLRTIEGLDLNVAGPSVSYELLVAAEKYLDRGLMVNEQNHLKLTREGRLWADAIASDLFFSEGVLPITSRFKPIL